ncbi:MAG: hypothetical protein JXB35_03770 [Anaerolineae bacterium]|nr:hypothetical protein [Anaerolineae bacterium]
MTWSIRPGREEAYLRFVTQEFPETLMKLQLQPTEAWYTIYGEWPEVTMGFMAENVRAIQDFLVSETWAGLKAKLMSFVKNYRQKVVPLKGGFQL